MNNEEDICRFFVLILLLPAFIDFVEAGRCEDEYDRCMRRARLDYFLCVFVLHGEEMACYMAKMVDVQRCADERADCGRCFHRTC